MNFRYGYAILVWLACATSLAAQPTVANISPTSVAAGQNATLTGTGLNAVTKVDLQADGKPAVAVTALGVKSDTSLAFTVPAATPALAYKVVLTPAATNTPALTVTDATPPPATVSTPATTIPKPVIDSVFPAAPFPNQKNRFNFEINGSNFKPDPIVTIEGPGDIRFKHRQDPGGCQQYVKNLDELPCLEASSDGRWLSIVGYERRYAYQGPIKVRVQVGSVASEPKSFTLSRIDHRIVVWLTLVVFALLAFIVYKLVARGIKPYMIAGQPYSPLAAFLLDKETDSYSLSKFQLLAFSSVSFFAYIYVFLCRALVQWNFDFPDVPENYPSLLAISAGTTAVAAGLGSMRGTKGGGPVLPSAADFICNGGMVVADRFQFFVWTLIACLGFIALILMQDPSTVQGFPTFPNGLLYVMGVSATGYLGGKVARNPGPVLKDVTVTAAASKDDLTVRLLGSNLDKKARFRIDGMDQSPVVPAPVGSAAADPAVTGISQAGAPTDYCSQLDFTLVRAASYIGGDHVFEIVNADGLGAQKQFTGSHMEIKPPAGSLYDSTGPVPVPLATVNYRVHSQALWQAPGAAAAQELAEPAFDAATNLVTVSLIPGTQEGAGMLTFTTPGGATETCTVNVVVDTMAITVPPAPVHAGATPVPVELTVAHYRPTSVARWRAPGAATTVDLPTPGFVAATNRVTLTLTPGTQPGTGTLTFAPGGATASCPLTVVA